MSPPVRSISSMATRQLMSELAQSFGECTGIAVATESAGGVDAAKRIEAGEPFDVVLLASDSMKRLESAHRLSPGSVVPLAHSEVAVAVRAGTPLPDINSDEALRRAIVAAPSIGYSTGPSGVALLQLFDRWGISGVVQQRLVQAPAGVPVGSLITRGDVAIGFQQLSELMGLEGIAVVGTMPAPVQIVTTFSAGVCAASPQPEAARALIAYLASPEAAATKRRHGMQPA